MIAKIIAVGRTREEALARLRRAMRETTVVIEGGACNKSFVLDLLAQPEVVDGTGGWRTPGGSTGSVPRDASSLTRTPAWRSSPRRSRRTPTRSSWRSPGCWRPRTAAAAGPAQARPRRRGQAPRHRLPGVDPEHRAVALPGDGDGRRAHHDRGGRARPPRRVPPAARGRRSTAPRGHLHLRPDHPGRGRRHRHRVTRDEGGVQRSPAPARGGDTRRRRRRGGGGRPGHRARVDEDGDGPPRAVPGPGQGPAGDHRQPGRDRYALVRLEQVGDEDTAWTSAVRRSSSRRPSRPPAAERLPGAAATSAPWGGFDVPPAAQDEACPRYCGAGGGRVGARGRARASAPSPTSPSSVATSPPTRSATPSPRAQLARALPHLPPGRRARWPAGTLQRAAGQGAAPLTACWISSAAPSWKRRSSGSSPSSGPHRRWRSPAPCSAAGSRSRCRPGTWRMRRLLERLGRATQLRFPVIGTSPAASGSAGSTSLRSTPSAPTCWP